jgi:hypothetical protein
MKVCVETHEAPGFGTIPEGSLWEDDSPYLVDEDKFVDVLEPEDEKPKPRAAVNKRER